LKVFNDWKEVKRQYKDIVVGLGNFDGVHLGHQRLISALVKEAEKIGGTSVVFTFNPHPLKVLSGKTPPMLFSQQAKEDTLRKMGVKVLLLVPFTNEFAFLSPEEFIEQVLIRGLGIKSVFIGYNYTFGKGGAGTAATLKEGGNKHGFMVNIIPPVSVDGIPVSSTLIRNLLKGGRVDKAAKMLGHYFFIEGPVVHGDKVGRGLGFPTANINIQEDIVVPANGIYAVKVQVDGKFYLGAANLGIKPTFCRKDCRTTLEVHLLDFQGGLYEKNIKIFFVRKIREEKRFDNKEKLIEQIRDDIKQVKKIFDLENKNILRNHSFY
jgi:riboflavin kinase/FMN adenylyltransferase